MTNEKLNELESLLAHAWPAPWVPRTFEIDCPCPNGEHCGDPHTCEEVEAPEAYPASHDDPAPEGEGQCVVQIDVPGLESLSAPNAAFIAAARNAFPELLSEVRRLKQRAEAAEAAVAKLREALEGMLVSLDDECLSWLRACQFARAALAEIQAQKE